MSEFQKAKIAWDNYVSWKNSWLRACANPAYPAGHRWTRHCNEMFLKAKAQYDRCAISHADVKVITKDWEKKMYEGVA